MISYIAKSKVSSWLYLLTLLLPSILHDKLNGQQYGDENDKYDLANMGFFFSCQVLLQRQSRDCGFIGYTFVVYSGWFKSLPEILYCLLPRPPQRHCDFSSISSQAQRILQVQDGILPSWEGVLELIELVCYWFSWFNVLCIVWLVTLV